MKNRKSASDVVWSNLVILMIVIVVLFVILWRYELIQDGYKYVLSFVRGLP